MNQPKTRLLTIVKLKYASGSMRFAVIFTLTGLVLLGQAVGATTWWGRALAADFALVCLLLGVAYAFNRPAFFLKGSKGRISAIGWWIYWPYFALNYATLHAFRARLRTAAYHLVADRVWLGCRALARDAPALGAVPIGAVLDAAAEFSEVAFLRGALAYLSLPVLDTRAPTLAQLQAAAAFIEREQQQHAVYVHCALGHGRSACFVLAWLLQTGRVPHVDAGLAQIQRIRPGVGFSPAQRAALAAFVTALSSPHQVS